VVGKKVLTVLNALSASVFFWPGMIVTAAINRIDPVITVAPFINESSGQSRSISSWIKGRQQKR
jgi:hypothetical protein